MKKFFNSIGLVLFSGLLLAPQLEAQELSLGLEAGSIGTSAEGVDPALGYGVFLQVDPYEWMGFQLDIATSEFEDVEGRFLFVNPAALFYLVNYEEFRLSLLPGAGFYSLPGKDSKTEFGLNAGMAVEFSLAPSFFLGLQSRYHGVFGADDFWSVMMKAGFRMNIGGGWDW